MGSIWHCKLYQIRLVQWNLVATAMYIFSVGMLVDLFVYINLILLLANKIITGQSVSVSLSQQQPVKIEKNLRIKKSLWIQLKSVNSVLLCWWLHLACIIVCWCADMLTLLTVMHNGTTYGQQPATDIDMVHLISNCTRIFLNKKKL